MRSIVVCEDSTDYIRRTETLIYYIAAAEDASKWLATLPKYQGHGKRGKKGKVNKDWNK